MKPNSKNRKAAGRSGVQMKSLMVDVKRRDGIITCRNRLRKKDGEKMEKERMMIRKTKEK
jgi:hypothetical protein